MPEYRRHSFFPIGQLSEVVDRPEYRCVACGLVTDMPFMANIPSKLSRPGGECVPRLTVSSTNHPTSEQP